MLRAPWMSVLLSLVVLAACPAHSTAQRAPDGTAAHPGSEAARALADAAAAERAGRTDEALARYAAVTAQFPTSPEAADALVASGELLLRLERRADARKSFEDAALRFPTQPAARRAKVGLARMDIQEGRTSEGMSALRSAYEDGDGTPPGSPALPEPGAPGTLGEAATAVTLLAEAEATAAPAEKEKLRSRLLDLVDSELSSRDVAALHATLPKGSYAHNLLTLKLARLYQHLGEDARAKEAYQEFIAADGSSAFAPLAQAALATLDQRTLVSPRRVGVILPMSGKYEQIGQRVLTALQLGFQASVNEAAARSPSGAPPPAPVEVVVMDDHGEPDGAAKAVDSLVQNDRVMAIVGAITIQGARDAAVRAEANKVPLLSMARREGLAEVGPWTFHMGLTDEKQARAVARLAVETLGFKRIAILYPRLPRGVALANAFWDTYESLGGRVAGAEAYDHDTTTFTAPVRKLVGRFYLEGRADFTQCVVAAKQVEAAYKRQKALEECKNSAAPVVDFDAIFIADAAKQVGYIAPALAFEDVFVGNDERSFKQFKQTTGQNNAKRIILLGTNGFNDKTLPTRGGKHVQGALFVDGFNPEDGRPETLAFLKAFQDHSGGGKAELREAQAYDAGRILGAIFSAGPQTRAEFRERLAAIKDFPGITGTTSFDAQGGSVAPLHVFTIKGEHIVPAVLEPRSGG